MNVDKYLVLNIALGLLCVVVGGFVAFAWAKREELYKWLHSPEIEEKIRQFCRLAEQAIIGSDLGEERLRWVVSMLYRYIPPEIAIFIPQEIAVGMMKAVIHAIFEKIAVTMPDGSRKAI